MTPYSFEEKDGTVYFKYKYSQIKQWLHFHRTEGDAGVLLYKRRGGLYTYLCSGTIENPMAPSPPFTSFVTLNLMHSPIFDGRMKTPEEICTPPKDTMFTNTRLVFLDMGEVGEPNIQNIKPKDE